MKDFSEYDKYDGLGLADLVRKGEVSPRELVDVSIERIEQLNPQLNAVIYKMYDAARKAAEEALPDGPFRGVPFLLKDLLAECAGVPMQSGCRFLKGFVPDHDSEMVRRFKTAGLIIVGKTNTPEFGLVPITEPELFGPSCNPWDLTRTTGGSSGGSAAAVASGMVPMAHGNDGGGSIRIPASCCGVFGFKPTRGRNPMGPDRSEVWLGLVSEHVLTRTVRDSAAMLDATFGPDAGAPYYLPAPSRPFLEEVDTDPERLRIAFSSEPLLPGRVHDDCLKGLQKTVALCRELGHEVVESAPRIDGKAFAEAFLTLICAELRADIEEAEMRLGRKASYKDFEPATWAAGLLGRHIKASEFSKAIRLIKGSARPIGRFFENHDVFLTPTLATPPIRTGALQPSRTETAALKSLGRINAGGLINALAGIEALAEKAFQFIPYTPVFNATGQPAMSVPLHWNDAGLPIGMHFIGRYGDEATLFRLAGQIERAVPWFDRRPPFCGSYAEKKSLPG